MEMIDKEKVIKGLEKCRRCECDNCTEKDASYAPWDCPAYDDFVDNAITLLKEQPEIIRCEECVYAEQERVDYEIWCPVTCSLRSLDWFCADGTRREGGDIE